MTGDDVVTGHGWLGLDGQGVLGELIGNVQVLQGPTVRGLVVGEVQRPDVVRVVGDQPVVGDGRGSDSGSLAFLDPHPQALLSA